jgi:hypothetical protein
LPSYPAAKKCQLLSLPPSLDTDETTVDTTRSRYDELLRVGATLLTGHRRRLFQAQALQHLALTRAWARQSWCKQSLEKKE